MNVAETTRVSVMSVVQVGAVPVQAPPQEAKTEPDAGEAVRVTDVGATRVSWQSSPQLIKAFKRQHPGNRCKASAREQTARPLNRGWVIGRRRVAGNPRRFVELEPPML